MILVAMESSGALDLRTRSDDARRRAVGGVGRSYRPTPPPKVLDIVLLPHHCQWQLYA